MFTIANGDRPEVDNVCIVVTDGDSDDYDFTVGKSFTKSREAT
jgi:hypothetical protein